MVFISICRVGLRSASVRAKRVPLAHSTIGQRCHRRACPSEARVSPPSSALQAENSCPIKRGTLSYVI